MKDKYEARLAIKIEEEVRLRSGGYWSLQNC
jgi:hypothetical protein